MKIYDVRENSKTKEAEIVAVEVEEKPKTFIITGPQRGAYGWRTRIPKDEAWMTPTEAVDVKLASRRNWLEAIEKRVVDTKREIASLEKLRKQL